MIIVSLFLTSCSAKSADNSEQIMDEVTEELPQPETERVDFYKSLDAFRKAKCKPDITKPSSGIGGEYEAGMWAPPTGTNVISYPKDLLRFGNSLDYGSDLENALVVSLAYMQELQSLYTYVHGMFRTELRASRGTYDIFLNKALNASRTLCNLEPEGFEFLGYTTDEYGDRIRYPDIDGNCRNLDPSELIKTIKIVDDIDYYCVRNNELSRSQQLKVQPILQNLLDNWDSMVMFVKATNYQIDKISAENDQSTVIDLPNCVEYPTDNPKYKIVKCTNLP